MRTQTNLRSGEAGPHILIGGGLLAARTLGRINVHTGSSAWAGRILCLISAATITTAQMFLSAETPPSRLIWTQLPCLPDKAGLGGCFAGASGKGLLVAGGCNFPDKKIWEGGQKAWHDAVYVLTEPDGEWQRTGRLPRPLAYGVSATTKHGVVCIGGADAERHYPGVFVLSWSKHGLQTKALPSLPTPLAYATGAAVGDTIYVTGGTTKPGAASASDTFFTLDLSQKEPAWRELESCPGKPRTLAVAGVLEGAFYLAGGTAPEMTEGKLARMYLRDAWRFRPVEGWERLADLPKPCSAGATPAPSYGSLLYVIGGDDGSLAGFQPMENHPGFSKGIQTYDTISNGWTSNHEAPCPNATVQTAFWRGRFVFPAGEPRPGIRSSEVWALNLSAGK